MYDTRPIAARWERRSTAAVEDNPNIPVQHGCLRGTPLNTNRNALITENK